MKTRFFWSALVAVALCGCAHEYTTYSYHQPLTSPGGTFSSLPPAVQNSVRAQVGMAEIIRISKKDENGAGIYEFQFRNGELYPPLVVASDGSVLDAKLNVVVGASVDTIAASTGSAVSGIKLDDLPPNVVQTIRHQAPTAEVESVSRMTSERDVFYNVSFKDPTHHRQLLVRDDGKLVQ